MRINLSVALMGVLALVLAAPAGLAQSSSPGFQEVQRDLKDFGDVTVTAGPRSLTVTWQGIEIGPGVSNWLREKVDGLDGEEADGNVSEGEAELAKDYVRMFLQREFSIYSGDSRYSGYLLIDYANPKGADVTQLDVTGLVGPVESEDGIGLGFQTAIGFATRSAEVHTVKLDMGRYYFREVNESKAAEVVGDTTLTVKAGPGWAIVADDIQPECARDVYDEETGAMVFTAEAINCFTGHSGVLLAFSISGRDDEGSSSIPGFELTLLPVALLGAAWTLRRRN